MIVDSAQLPTIRLRPTQALWALAQGLCAARKRIVGFVLPVKRGT